MHKSQLSILIIIPYFGPLPSYSDLFFHSCSKNQDINWLFVTDQDIDPADLPMNVKLRKMQFQDLNQRINRVMGFEVALSKPYKLCDFKPAYGLIFEEELASYDFWGHCDMDMIFGDLRKFITDDVLEQYCKVLIRGHLSLYRNNDEAKNYFRLFAPGINYKSIFTNTAYFGLDEWRGLYLILKHNNIPFFHDEFIADLDPSSFKMRTIKHPNYRYQAFCWDNGKVFRIYWKNCGIFKQEYAYIHLQKRKMKAPFFDPMDYDAWFITPDGFTLISDYNFDFHILEIMNRSDVLFNLNYLWRNNIQKVKRKLNVPYFLKK